MKKEELKEKLNTFAQKSKKFSLDIASLIKEKTEDLARTFRRNKDNKTLQEPIKIKEDTTKKEMSKKDIKKKSSANLNLYDKRGRDLEKGTSDVYIKPMSATGQKVNIKNPSKFSFKKFAFKEGFTTKPFSSFTAKILFLGSAFISGWFLGQSFNKDSFSFAAFVSLFLIGFTLRYIRSIKGSLFYGFLTGFFTSIFIFDWIYDTVLTGTGNYILAASSLLGLSIILAGPLMVFCLCAWQYKHKEWIFPLASACAWVALELLVQWISYKGLGFPWFVLGYTQYANTKLIQISSVLGAYGVSFFIVFCSFSAALVLSRGVNFGKRLLNLLFIVLIYFAVSSYGERQLSYISEETKTFKVAIVQPNTHKEMIYDNLDKVTETLNSIAASLEEEKNLDLIIWPESTIPGYLEEGPFKDFMAKVSTNTKAAQLAGATAHQEKKTKKSKNMQEEEQEFVSAGLYQKGALVAKHDKRKLVPFGEFLPFKKQLNNFYKENDISSLTGSFVEGKGPAQVLTLKSGEDKTSFGVQICFESIFPILWRLETLGGAEFFVNISNDGWFLDTSAPYQHLRINAFRAVENSRPILRSANSGISAYIDNFGKIQYQSRLNEQTVEIVELPLPMVANQTFYSIYGDIFAFLCLFLTLAFSYNCLEFTQDYD